MANFTNYGDVQAALNKEHAEWASGNLSEQAKKDAAAARAWWASYTPPKSNAPSPAPAPPPPPPPPPPPSATTTAVKQPSPSLVNYDAEVLPQELITDLLYEDVGGVELINISRYDTINGQPVVYSLIRNLSVLNQSFNPNNILAGQIVYSNQFRQYALEIASKMPQVGEDYPNGPIYVDDNGDLVVEFLSIGSDEYAEIEISTNGTIYTITPDILPG